jgi:hypothetical protein
LGYSLEQFQNTQPASSEKLKAWKKNIQQKLADNKNESEEFE